ncbi:MAG: outer membrane protein assembly factor BamD [Rickettsiales bacterium]|nr:outer membrane protein assembly factor BamD [Rickettsiales bacterium]
MFKKIILLLYIGVFLVSCAGNRKDETIDVDGQVLYEKAMKNFNKKYYSTAGKEFEEIEEKFIFTPLATKSIIMSIYSYYMAKKYDDSLRLIEYYKRINFGNENIEYVYYMGIVNKYEKVMKSKKDLTLMNELYEDIEYMLGVYKVSKYRDDVLRIRKEVIRNIIKNELSIYKFYINNNDFIGALNHLNEIMTKFQENDYTAEILYKIMVLYKYINYDDGVNKCMNRLKNDYGDTRWYKYAIKQ